MDTLVGIMPVLIGASLVAVVATLVIGIGGMAKGGGFNSRNSNRLMRYRVGFQALTVLLVVIYFLLLQQQG